MCSSSVIYSLQDLHPHALAEQTQTDYTFARVKWKKAWFLFKSARLFSLWGQTGSQYNVCSLQSGIMVSKSEKELRAVCLLAPDQFMRFNAPLQINLVSIRTAPRLTGGWGNFSDGTTSLHIWSNCPDSIESCRLKKKTKTPSLLLPITMQTGLVSFTGFRLERQNLDKVFLKG